MSRSVMLTGLPGSGKTTIGSAVVNQLSACGTAAELLDGDELRRRLPPPLGFSREDRIAQARRACYVAEILMRHRIVPVLALVLPYRETRGELKSRLGSCTEVHLRAPVDVCAARDHSGLYARVAADGDLEYSSILAPYEPPEAPDIALDTATTPVETCAGVVVERLKQETPQITGASGVRLG